MSNETEQPHVVTPHLYVSTWIALVGLTVMTVGASYLNLRNVAILAAVIIASVKASLVLLYFMHLRFERLIYVRMLIAALGFLAICLLLSFTDYSFR